MACVIFGAVKPITATEGINPKCNTGFCNVFVPLLLATGLRQLTPSRTSTGWILNGDACGSDLNRMSSSVVFFFVPPTKVLLLGKVVLVGSWPHFCEDLMALWLI